MDCPHCASYDLEVVRIQFAGAAALAVHVSSAARWGRPHIPMFHTTQSPLGINARAGVSYR